jgi:hypothetical protein
MHHRITAVSGILSGLFGAAIIMAVVTRPPDGPSVRSDIFAVLLSVTVVLGVVSLGGWTTAYATRAATAEIVRAGRAAIDEAARDQGVHVYELVSMAVQGELAGAVRTELANALADAEDRGLQRGIVLGAQGLAPPGQNGATVTQLRGH